jgi:ATP-dependent DNA helicase Rep
VKDVMAYLRLLANPNDDAAFLRIINTPRREIGPATLEKLGNYATGRRVSLLAACAEIGLEQTLTGRHLQRLRTFGSWLAGYQERTQREQPMAAIRQMLLDLDYEGWLYDKSSSDKTAEKCWANVSELLEWLQRLHQQSNSDEGLADMISKLTLQDVLERQDDDSGGDQVHLMTLVFLVGMEEELLPHRSSIEDESIEEERRLAYVGITRARQILTISYASKRKKFGEIISCEPSRFLDELPEEELLWEGRGNKLSVEEKKARGNAHLANLRSMLS